MKELSIEEKAKAYDKAKYIMKEYLKSGNAGVIAENTIKKAFPELAESEDERIRKWLIHYFKEVCDNVSEKEKKGVLAYLEKQGEQKPAFEMKTPEESLGIDSDTYSKIVDECVYGEQKPTNNQFTPEQASVLDKHIDKFLEQNHTWSEEDEKMLNDILICGEHHCYLDAENIAWLKSLKDRYTWKPSDAQMASIICAVRKMKESACYDSELVSLFNDLKKLKEE